MIPGGKPCNHMYVPSPQYRMIAYSLLQVCDHCDLFPEKQAEIMVYSKQHRSWQRRHAVATACLFIVCEHQEVGGISARCLFVMHWSQRWTQLASQVASLPGMEVLPLLSQVAQVVVPLRHCTPEVCAWRLAVTL